MKTKPVIITLMLTALAAAVVIQYCSNQNLKSAVAQLKASNQKLSQLRSENERLRKLAGNPTELAALRKDQLELARLRSQIGQHLKQKPTNAAASQHASTNDVASQIESFSAAVQARIGLHSTLVTGGWPTKEGKRAFVFITPSIPDTNSDTIEYTSRLVEAPDRLWATVGLSGGSANTNSTFLRTLSQQEFASMLLGVESSAESEVLDAPRSTTTNGRVVQVSAGDQVFVSPDGTNAVLIGPSFQITGNRTEDGEAFDLSVEAQFNMLSEDEEEFDLDDSED